MSLLLLDPLVLTAYLGVAAYGWLVCSGRFRSWFAPQRLWLGVWPLPAVIAVVPLLVGPVLRLLDGLGPGDEEGGLAAVVVYVVANGVPLAWLVLAPPRWLLPAWARRRLATPPSGVPLPAPSAVPAVHAPRAEGRVTWPRWRWWIDAQPGHVWVDGGQLRFRAVDDADTDGLRRLEELDQSEIDQLELRWGDEARLEPPRGGWWTRRRLDVELSEVDDWRIGRTRPWGGGGLLCLQVQGRRPVRLWVGDADAVRRAITAVRDT